MEFKCNIVIYKYEVDNNSKNIYVYETISSKVEALNPPIPIIFIAGVNEDRYELMFINNLQIEEIPLEYNILNHE